MTKTALKTINILNLNALSSTQVLFFKLSPIYLPLLKKKRKRKQKKKKRHTPRLIAPNSKLKFPTSSLFMFVLKQNFWASETMRWENI